jgi:hypothetical protein
MHGGNRPGAVFKKSIGTDCGVLFLAPRATVVVEEASGVWLTLPEFAVWLGFDSVSRANCQSDFLFWSFHSGVVMKNLRDMTVGAVSVLASGVASAQYGNMMGGGTWGSGWIGYGVPWVPILLVIVVAGLVGWAIGRKGK